mmetsp:Transcript_25031/g.49851  ORF Transcript_25031/g.49851 Transcript_25031/m.49851 type:complete len:101 (-) Transcript_25031:48-350(-)
MATFTTSKPVENNKWDPNKVGWSGVPQAKWKRKKEEEDKKWKHGAKEKKKKKKWMGTGKRRAEPAFDLWEWRHIFAICIIIIYYYLYCAENSPYMVTTRN